MKRSRTKSTATDDTHPERHASTSNTASVVSSEREVLIQERQSELGKIFTRHDSLIREQFMLQNYGLMLFYDPDVAKQDQTNEFLQFKNKHDLMRFMPGAGPSRATRRAQTDLVSTLSQIAGTSISAAQPSESSASAITKPNGSGSKVTTTARGKQKQATAGAATSTTREQHGSAKPRGKRKAVDESRDAGSFSDGDRITESISSRRPSHKARERPKVASDFNRISSRATRSHSVLTDETSSAQQIVPDRPSRKSLHDATASFSRPAKKRRLPDDRGVPRQLHIMLPPPPEKPSSLPATGRPTTSGKSLPGKTLPSNAVPRTIIRRIKLIVRPPARTYSSPRQRPNPALFGYSVPALLASYVEVDGKSYTATSLEAAARRDARLLNKIDELKRIGRFPDRRLAGGSASPTHLPTDTWSNVVSEAIAARNALPRYRFGHVGALAAVVHAKLHAHWDLMKKDLEREQVLEERRLRALAKSILRLVLAEWKKAVFHVREQARLVYEAEEARRGRLHLDAILDQSGQILEKQQLELVRSESASMGSDEEEEETDVDSSEEGMAEDASEVPTEVDEGDKSTVLVQDRERHVDFAVPLNDVDMDTEKITSPDTPHTSAMNSDVGDDDKEDGVRSDFDLEEEMDMSTNGDDAEEEPDAEPETNISQDDDELPSSEADMLSSKASLESSSFMQDILPPAFRLSPDSTDIPPLDMTNGLEHESIVIPSESITGEQMEATSSPLPPKVSSKPKPTDERDLLVVEPLDASQGSITKPSLTNGHSKHLEHVGTVDNTEIDPAHAGFKSDLLEEVNVSLPQNVNGGADHRTVTNDLSPALEASSKDDAPEHESEIAADNPDVSHDDNASTEDTYSDWEAPADLQPYAVAHVKWEPGSKILPPLLLRGTLRPYQQSGLEWLVSLHNNETNGILADEMGLGKTIQTIALLAHLACDRGIWGPHLIVVPTSVLLNWEMEFKKFLPGFKILSYHGTTKRRKELRQGWNNKYAFNVCITSYTLASRDQHIFKRKAWYYMVLDEAHMIKNFKSQRWNILLMFRSRRRLLLTGTPLQNNLTELWALLRFLMSGANFANQKEFSEWFGNPLEKAIELGNLQDEEVQLQVAKLHEMLRPFLLRRLKKDVEKELPKKYDHLVLCRLSKRQRFLYDEFMSRRQTRDDLQSGVYQKIANILMQLRKVCNHPDLFEVRPIVTSLTMEKSAIADFEIKELLVRRRLFEDDRSSHINLDAVGLRFTHLCNSSLIAARSTRSLEELLAGELAAASPGEAPPRDLRTIEGFRKYNAYQRRLSTYMRYRYMAYLNRLRCNRHVLYGLETILMVNKMYNPLTIACEAEFLSECRPANHLIKPYWRRAEEASDLIEKFAFATPSVIARDIPDLALRELPMNLMGSLPLDFDDVLHKPAVKLQIAFPDISLLQYDCGKLQELDRLLRERKSGGHRVLIFTQMTRILDILETFLNFHGYLYLRLDGATKIEDRQYITERFNADPRVFAFIASSRSGGVGINLTGADTVIFYDSDFNPQMDKQCEDRAHRIGQIRDVHIYRFISHYTVEEAMLRKANQKRSLDDLVIQKGDFDWKNFFRAEENEVSVKASALQKALVEFEDFEDAEAAKIAAREEALLQGEDQAEFDDGDAAAPETPTVSFAEAATPVDEDGEGDAARGAEEEEEEGGATIDYMIKFVRSDLEFFKEWKLP